ncbi:MAG: hypothetical protein ACXACO_02765 [Promethearchaeota archaeon]|jgi:tetratricopeptide (TPR) repeat protein
MSNIDLKETNNSISDQIQHGWLEFNEGNPDNVLMIVADIEKTEDLTPVESLKCQILKGLGLLWTGKAEGALKIGNYAYNEGVKLGKPLISIDAIILIRFSAIFLLSRTEEVWEDIRICEQLLKSAFQEPSSEIERGEALLNYIKGYSAFWEGRYDYCLEHLKKCLLFFEESTSLSIYGHFILTAMGAACTYKGELEQGLKYITRSLDVSKETILSKFNDTGNYKWLGLIYSHQGKLDLSIRSFKNGMRIVKQYNDPFSIGFVSGMYIDLIDTCLRNNAQEEAKEYFNKYQLFVEEKNFPNPERVLRFSKAKILKSSSRTRDRAEAEKILKDMLKSHEALKKVGTRGMLNEPTGALLELCTIYIEELSLTHDLSILNEIQPLLERLLTESTRTNSYLLQAYTYLMKGSLSLLQLNMGDARRYLTQAQDLAEENGLQLLARYISKEHDKLLEQLDKLETTSKSDESLSERLDLASLGDIINKMQGKRAIKAPELVNEDPKLLLIITEGGVPVFSYPFTDDWNQEEELFGSFMTAITSFSSEFFSEGLDRVKFGRYTVLMKPVAELSSCYLFKGPTYLAKQKLTSFVKGIETNKSIIQALMKFYQASQVVELKDFPFLDAYIKQIFVSD